MTTTMTAIIPTTTNSATTITIPTMASVPSFPPAGALTSASVESDIPSVLILLVAAT